MSKGKKVKKSRKTKERDAHRRAELIFMARSGQISITAAASELGVSRKTYYQWEAKAFDSMVDALQEGEPGRPALPPEVEENRKLKEFMKFQEGKIAELKHRENLIIEACEMKVSLAKGRAEKKCGYSGTSG